MGQQKEKKNVLPQLSDDAPAAGGARLPQDHRQKQPQSEDHEYCALDLASAVGGSSFASLASAKSCATGLTSGTIRSINPWHGSPPYRRACSSSSGSVSFSEASA